MSDTVHAIVTRRRGINHAGEHHADAAVIPLPEGQFQDWRAMGWVDRATPEQIEAARIAAEEAAAKQAERDRRNAARREKRQAAKADPLDHDHDGARGGSLPAEPPALAGKNKAALLDIAAAEDVAIEDGATNDQIRAAIEAKREAAKPA